MHYPARCGSAGQDMPGARQPAPPPQLRTRGIRLVVMLYVRFPPSLRNVEDLLLERGIDICYEPVRYWWNRFGSLFAAEVAASG
jgi:putative transposase